MAETVPDTNMTTATLTPAPAYDALRAKVADLAAKITDNSISPSQLASLLGDIVSRMEAIDMTSMRSNMDAAAASARTALARSLEAFNKAEAAIAAYVEETSAKAVAAVANQTAETARSNAAKAHAEALAAKSACEGAQAVAAVANQTAETARSNAAKAHAEALAAKSACEGAQAVAGDALEMTQALTDTLAQPGGIATLGQTGKVAAAQLPLSCVVEFAKFVENASVSTGKSEASSNSAAFDVVFDRTGKRFLLRFERLTAGGIGDGGTIRSDDTVLPDLQGSITGPAQISGLTQYWADWADRDKFALNAGRVYICTSDASLHVFNGSTLTAITVAHLEDAAAKTSETLTDHEQRIVFTELGLGATQEQCRQAHEQLAAMDTIFLKETTFPMTEAGQKIDRDLAAKQDKLTPQMFAELWTQARNLNLIS